MNSSDLSNIDLKGMDFVNELYDPAQDLSPERLGEILGNHFQSQAAMQGAMGYADNGGAQLRKMIAGKSIPLPPAAVLLLLIIGEHPNFVMSKRVKNLNEKPRKKQT